MTLEEMKEKFLGIMNGIQIVCLITILPGVLAWIWLPNTLGAKLFLSCIAILFFSLFLEHIFKKGVEKVEEEQKEQQRVQTEREADKNGKQ